MSPDGSRVLLIVAADQGAVAVLYGRDIDFHGSTAYSTTQYTHPEVPDTLRSSYELYPDSALSSTADFGFSDVRIKPKRRAEY